MALVHANRLAAWLVLASGLVAGMSGCGTPGAPMPPSLNLPDRVTDLTAVRAGNRVALTWSMPKKSTDKLLLKADVTVHVCRQLQAGDCAAAGADLLLAPGADGTFAETLPAPLAEGSPRPLTYFVELKNRNGRSAGLSNAATILAGDAPPAVDGLTAELRKAGVVLRWTAGNDTNVIRLHRKLVGPAAAKPKESILAPPPEPVEQDLLVAPAAESAKAPTQAIDKSVRAGQTYQYTAQRVARLTVAGQTLELASQFSAPVLVEVQDVFPPAVPTGLEAVATAQGNGAETAIDLSWQPVADADIAGYAVYRLQGQGGWQRISPPQPIVGPAFHDAQVEPGQSYRYAVSAIALNGHESARSAEAEETVPAH